MKHRPMIFGSVEIKQNAVVTHRDSYLLDNLSVVSVRRPFLGGTMLLSAAFSAFGLAFGDILFIGEIVSICGFSAIAVLTGVQIGQLKLLSRDLRGSELSGVIWGRYASLNKVRSKIVENLGSCDKGANL